MIYSLSLSLRSGPGGSLTFSDVSHHQIYTSGLCEARHSNALFNRMSRLEVEVEVGESTVLKA
jgi:hypothetical protein